MLTVVHIKVRKLKESGDDVVPFEQYVIKTSLVEFFFGELRDVWFGLIPPLYMLNYFLRQGGCGSADRNIRGIHFIYDWDPFEVTPEQHRQLAEALHQLPDRPFEDVEPPKNVRTVQEYEHWSFVRWMERHRDGKRRKGNI